MQRFAKKFSSITYNVKYTSVDDFTYFIITKHKNKIIIIPFFIDKKIININRYIFTSKK